MDGWQKVEGYYKAETGEEEYIYIGNFNNFVNTPLTVIWPGIEPLEYIYFYIDDISLVECDGLDMTETAPANISIYPNPAVENVTITLPPNTNKAELFIHTVQGQLLSRTQLIGTQTITTSNLTNGLYLFVIQSNGEIIGREKVIVSQ